MNNAARWERGVETRQFLERRFDLSDADDTWQTIWANELPLPAPASLLHEFGTNSRKFYRVRLE